MRLGNHQVREARKQRTLSGPTARFPVPRHPESPRTCSSSPCRSRSEGAGRDVDGCSLWMPPGVGADETVKASAFHGRFFIVPDGDVRVRIGPVTAKEPDIWHMGPFAGADPASPP